MYGGHLISTCTLYISLKLCHTQQAPTGGTSCHFVSPKGPGALREEKRCGQGRGEMGGGWEKREWKQRGGIEGDKRENGRLEEKEGKEEWRVADGRDKGGQGLK